MNCLLLSRAKGSRRTAIRSPRRMSSVPRDAEGSVRGQVPLPPERLRLPVEVRRGRRGGDWPVRPADRSSPGLRTPRLPAHRGRLSSMPARTCEPARGHAAGRGGRTWPEPELVPTSHTYAELWSSRRAIAGTAEKLTLGSSATTRSSAHAGGVLERRAAVSRGPGDPARAPRRRRGAGSSRSGDARPAARRLSEWKQRREAAARPDPGLARRSASSPPISSLAPRGRCLLAAAPSPPGALRPDPSSSGRARPPQDDGPAVPGEPPAVRRRAVSRSPPGRPLPRLVVGGPASSSPRRGGGLAEARLGDAREARFGAQLVDVRTRRSSPSRAELRRRSW